MAEYVREAFYEGVREDIEGTTVDKIRLLDENQEELVTMDLEDERVEYKILTTGVEIVASIKGDEEDIPADETTYWGSVLLNSEGDEVTEKVSHVNATLNHPDDELTSIHELEIPEQEE